MAAIVAAMAASVTTAAHAQDTVPSNVAEARDHFEKGRAFYEHGSYREAVAEFEAAHDLDPNAKDLVYNLAFVNEKLDHLDEAITWLHLYLTMALSAPERDKADAYVHRLEGRREEERRQAEDQRRRAEAATRPSTTTSPPNVPPPAAPTNGRIDAATIGVASVSGAALVFGIVMGVKAKEDVPPDSFVTGRDGTYADLQDRLSTAHREAVFADVGFGVSILAAAAAVYLYVARPRASVVTLPVTAAPPAAPVPGSSASSSPTASLLPGPSTPSAGVSIVTFSGGPALFVQGSF